MNLEQSTRSANVIDYRGVPYAQQPLTATEQRQDFLETQQIQRFRAKLLLGVVAAVVAWHVLKRVKLL